MPGIRFSAISLLILLQVIDSSGQSEFDIENYLQNLLPSNESHFENTEAYETLINYYQHPLNLNKADKSELGALFILSDRQIQNLIDYRDEYGNFLSVYELQAVPGFDVETVSRLKPFIMVSGAGPDTRSFLERLSDPEIHYLISRYDKTLERKKGFEKNAGSPYLGSPDKYLIRYRLQRYGDYSFGLTFEKDAGEPILWDPSKASYFSDFQSFHISLENRGPFRQILIGDYQLQFGQGLVYSSGFSLGKGAETILSVKRSENSIRAYGSAMEYGFLRGGAIKYQIGKWHATPFFARQRIDASLGFDSIDGTNRLSSVSANGLHRTENEISKKNALEQNLFGLHIEKHFRGGNIGLLYSRRIWEYALIPGNHLHDFHDFRGRINQLAAFHYDFLVGEMSFFGETAVSKSRGFATINGIIIPLGSKTDFSMLHRYFHPSFHTIAGAPFAEGSSPQNESGIYLGLKHQFSRKWILSAFADSFRNPWLKANLRSAGNGQELLFRLDHRIRKGSELMFQYRFGDYEYSNSQLSQSYKVQKKRQDELVLQLNQSSGENLLLRSRIQFKNAILESRSTGFIISQDVQYTFGRINLAGRLAYFSTDDYESRFYILEKDVLYSLSAPAYFGQGARQYFLIKYRPSRAWSFWLKWSRTVRTDVNELGSGNESIQGNRRNDLRLQVKVSF